MAKITIDLFLSQDVPVAVEVVNMLLGMQIKILPSVSLANKVISFYRLKYVP